MRRKLPTDLEGKQITYKQEHEAKRNYKPDRKAWNFPFKHAFERAKVKSHD